ncbi:hypothetical protein D3C71_781580 [compost metagenome]
MRRVDQWTQHVKQGAGFQLLANRHRVAETGVVFRCEQETDAQIVQCFSGTFGVHLEINPKGGQQIRRAGTAGDAAVTVFRHFHPAGSGDKGAGGRDINAVAAVAAGADDISEGVIRTRERGGVFQQSGGRTGNFLRLFAAHFHADQCGSQLFWLQLAAHDRREELMAFLLSHGLRLIQFFQNRLQGVGLLQFL